MSVGSILVGIVLLAALGIAVAWPWWQPTTRRVARLASGPHAEYEALVAAIRDLDFDYQAGVVAEDDYRALRADLAARAVSLMQTLEHSTLDVNELDTQIEAAVSTLRAQRRAAAEGLSDGAGTTICPNCARRTRASSRFCVHCGAALDRPRRLGSVRVCPDCDAPVEPEDRYCATCGRSLTEEVVAV